MDRIPPLCVFACQFVLRPESHVPSEAAHKSLSLVNKYKLRTQSGPMVVRRSV